MITQRARRSKVWSPGWSGQRQGGGSRLGAKKYIGHLGPSGVGPSARTAAGLLQAQQIPPPRVPAQAVISGLCVHVIMHCFHAVTLYLSHSAYVA